MAADKARPDDGAVAAVQSYIDALSAGDIDVMSDCFAAMGVILDGMAPQLWLGGPALREWRVAAWPGPRAGRWPRRRAE